MKYEPKITDHPNRKTYRGEERSIKIVNHPKKRVRRKLCRYTDPSGFVQSTNRSRRARGKNRLRYNSLYQEDRDDLT